MNFFDFWAGFIALLHKEAFNLSGSKYVRLDRFFNPKRLARLEIFLAELCQAGPEVIGSTYLKKSVVYTVWYVALY